MPNTIFIKEKLSNGDQVKILGEMKNLKINAKEVYMQLDQAFDSNGEECLRATDSIICEVISCSASERASAMVGA